MGECLHTSADGLSKLVKWAHSHGTICTLIPSLKHMLTEGSHGQLTALWGCGAGHAYHWPVTASCKTVHKDRTCYDRSSQGISSESLIQGAAAMQSGSAQRFLGSTSKSSKGDTNQTRDSYDFSNCSEPSEMDDNTEEDNSHLFDIVCESSATDEEVDLEPRVLHRKRVTKGPNYEDSGHPGAKKIKQERAEDYFTVANAQAAQASQAMNSHIRSSSGLSASNNPLLLDDGDLAQASSSPVETSSHSKSSIGRSESKTHMDSNPGASQHMSGLCQAGKSDSVEVLPNGDFGINFEDPSDSVHPEIDILAEQQNSTEPGSDGTGYLEEQFWPSTSELCPNSEGHFEERKQLEEFITSVDPGTLRSLQGVISRLLVFNEQSRAVVRSPPRPGEQELFPGSGLCLPPYKLACIHQESRQDSMRLFHLLFEHFFTEEDLIGAVAFGKRGKVPDGKKILDRRKVDGIISAGPGMYEVERLKGLLQAEKNKSALLGETVTSLKQDKELLQQELTKKAELICEFLQDQLRPEKRRSHSSGHIEAGSSNQQLISSFPDEGAPFESPALFDSFEDVELQPLERQRPVKISSKRNRDGESTRVRMKNVVGVIARYMASLQEYRRSVSMKVAFDRVGVDRNTISRTAPIAELSLAAPEVFHALPPWDEKEETLGHYAVRCRLAMDDNIKAKIKAMKAKGELLPIVSK